MEAPCAKLALVWRQCLKEDDYSPDRDFSKCDSQREGYYTCLNAWRATQGAPPVAKTADFEVHPKCAQYSARLETCMKMSMFQVSECQQEMGQLRKCAATHDSNVREALKYEADAQPVKRWGFW